ncbi:MAG: hypothetical protein AB1942_12190 [Pseudomonadota bacterium]
MAAKYNVGDIVDGYEFMGGDYRDKANWQDWGEGARRLPDGSVVRNGPRGGMQFLRKATTGQGGEPLREFEVNAAARAALMDEGQREYERAKADGYDPTSWKNSAASALETVPFAGTWMADVLRDNPGERARLSRPLRGGSGVDRADDTMRAALLACFALAACQTPTEPQIVTKEVKVPVPVACAADPGPEPAYSDTPEALRGAADLFEQVKLLLAGRAQRDARLTEPRAASAGCR